MPMFVLSLGTQGLRWLGEGEGGGCASRLIFRCLLPDVCSRCVSRNASVSVAQRGLIVACRKLPITGYLSNFWVLAILKE